MKNIVAAQLIILLLTLLSSTSPFALAQNNLETTFNGANSENFSLGGGDDNFNVGQESGRELFDIFADDNGSTKPSISNQGQVATNNVLSEIESASTPLQEVSTDEPNLVPTLEDPSYSEENDPLTGVISTENEFSGTPFLIGGRKIMALGEAPEYYKVQPGDTLYDICDQLIDDPSYWPKLWALNPGIRNPHFIFPGMILTFYPGDDVTPPYLQVVNEDEVLPLATVGLSDSELNLEPISDDIPVDNAADGIAATAQLEGRFVMSHGKETYSSEFEYVGTVYEPNIYQIDIPAFVFAERVTELGAVISGPKGEVSVPEGEQVIFEVESNANLGPYLTVVRPSQWTDGSSGDDVGYRYDFVAQVKVVESLAVENAIIAQVVKSRLSVQPDDLLIDYRSTSRTYNVEVLSGANADENIEVIGFEYPTQRMGGQGNLVYLNKELSPGGVYPIYQDVSQRIPQLIRTNVPKIPTKIGDVKIIDTVGKASLGVILNNNLDIRLGDRAGRGRG